MVKAAHLNEVFVSNEGGVYQDDKRNCLVVEFLGEQACYDIKGFFQLKALVDQVDIYHMIQDATTAGLEIINPLFSERCYVLNLCEILKLRSLLNGAKTMLELNSIIQERIYTQLTFV
jgi:hypothetical protein